MNSDDHNKTYTKTFSALEGDFRDVTPPESMKKNVQDSIERFGIAKALLELHVFAPGLVFGVDPEDIVDEEIGEEDNAEDGIDIRNY